MIKDLEGFFAAGKELNELILDRKKNRFVLKVDYEAQ